VILSVQHFRPHRMRSIDAAYCYRSPPVRASLCVSVCISVMIVSRVQTAEPIEMSFWADLRRSMYKTTVHVDATRQIRRINLCGGDADCRCHYCISLFLDPLSSQQLLNIIFFVLVLRRLKPWTTYEFLRRDAILILFRISFISPIMPNVRRTRSTATDRCVLLHAAKHLSVITRRPPFIRSTRLHNYRQIALVAARRRT